MVAEKNIDGIARVLRSADEANKQDKNSLLAIAMTSVVCHGAQPLYISAREIVGSVLKLGGDLNMRLERRLPLSIALGHSDIVLAKILLEAKANIYRKDVYEISPLDYALTCSSKEQKLQSVQFLIDAGADGSRYYSSNRYPSSEQSKRDSFYFETLLKMNLPYSRVPEDMIQKNPELRQTVNKLKELAPELYP